MKVVSSGSIFEIFDDDLKTYNRLPNGVFDVKFSKNRGYFLQQRADMEVKETKIYGSHESKVAKVLGTFQQFDRNLGVILSGAKGIGKSLFARLLSNAAVANDIPVLIIDKYLPGVTSYLNGIEQEVLVLFDEFDKTYGEAKAQDGMAPPQTELLSLFDGTSIGKKLFVITCNEIRRLNEYLLNRPGRFHYHFRFENPSADEIREYLTDKLNKDYYHEIDNVISFAQRVDINFDCLRAIAFEINQGETFKSAIKDLNIVNQEQQKYIVKLHYHNGAVADFGKVSLDLFGRDNIILSYGKVSGRTIIEDIEFSPCNCVYSSSLSANVVDAKNIILTYYSDHDCDKEEVEIMNVLKACGASHLTLEKVAEKSIHYMV